MDIFVLLFSAIVGVRESTSEYIPGTPGASWSEVEVRIVKAKLSRLFDVDQSSDILNEYMELHPNETRPDLVNRPLGPVLRLGFHDCLRYTDGTGGCDGCLEFNGFVGRFEGPWYHLKLNKTDISFNNGLQDIVKIFEEYYTNANFPSRTPSLPQSLKSSGKSRADLWAFAAVVAVEYSIETNNGVCDDAGFERPSGYTPSSNQWNWARMDPSNGGAHCNAKQGESGCRIEMSRPIAFRTGRRDCVVATAPHYITTKKERHPDSQTNGRGTVDFFKRDFNFTGRETVAIMGTHTMGRLHMTLTMFPYVWIKSGGQQFNNQYYRNLASKPDWHFVHDQGSKYGCTKQGDAWGQKPQTRWLTNTRLHLTTGGPTFWIMEKLVCTQVCMREDDVVPNDGCCTDSVPSGASCRPDGNRPNGSIASEQDCNNFWGCGCEKFKFHSGLDECMLNAEMGLYKDFSVDDDGIPYGCPGFETFNLQTWKSTWKPGTTFESHFSTINGIRAEPQCPLNTLEEPVGSTPLHEIIEEYAEHQEIWVRDYVPTFEKVISNGYEPDDLTAAPDQWTGITCPRNMPEDKNEYWAIWSGLTIGAPFILTSQLDNRVLQMNSANGNVEVGTRATPASANQMWYWASDGNMLVNAHGQKLLALGGILMWDIRPGVGEADDSVWKFISGKNYKGEVNVIDRGWTQSDGQVCVVWEEHGAVNQRWSIEMLPTPEPTTTTINTMTTTAIAVATTIMVEGTTTIASTTATSIASPRSASTSASSMATSIAASSITTSTFASSMPTSFAASSMLTSTIALGMTTSIVAPSIAASTTASSMATSFAASSMTTSIVASSITTSNFGSSMPTSFAVSSMMTSSISGAPSSMTASIAASSTTISIAASRSTSAAASSTSQTASMVVISTTSVAESFSMFVGSMSFVGVSLSKMQVEVASKATLAIEFGVDQDRVSATVVQSRRLDDQHIGGQKFWSVEFSISVPLDKATIAERKVNSIIVSPSQLTAVMKSELINAGVSPMFADVVISSFAATSVSSTAVSPGTTSNDNDTSAAVESSHARASSSCFLVLITTCIIFARDVFGPLESLIDSSWFLFSHAKSYFGSVTQLSSI